MRPTLDGFVWLLLFLAEQLYAIAAIFTGFVNLLRPTLDGFVLGTNEICLKSEVGRMDPCDAPTGKSCSVFRVRVVRDVSCVRSCARVLSWG